MTTRRSHILLTSIYRKTYIFSINNNSKTTDSSWVSKSQTNGGATWQRTRAGSQDIGSNGMWHHSYRFEEGQIRSTYCSCNYSWAYSIGIHGMISHNSQVYCPVSTLVAEDDVNWRVSIVNNDLGATSYLVSKYSSHWPFPRLSAIISVHTFPISYCATIIPFQPNTRRYSSGNDSNSSISLTHESMT